MRNETVERCPDVHLFAAGCASCIAHWMAARSLQRVEQAWADGMVPTSARDAYRYVWATSGTRSAAYAHWAALPDGADARVFARLLREILTTGG